MGKKELTIVAIETHPQLTKEDVCLACQITESWLNELISYGVIDHHRDHFDTDSLSRIRRVNRLQDDLGLNLAGAALALDLIDRIDSLQSQVELFQKYINLAIKR